MTAKLQVRVQDHSGTIILRRPEKCNAMTRAMLHQYREALSDLHRERRVKAVIVTGSGDHFCAGTDLAEIRGSQKEDNPESHWFQDADALRQTFEAMLRFPKPIVAAINGDALGAGAGLVLASDIVVASSDASFGFPEPRRGLAAGVVIPLLVFRAGGGAAANLLLRADPIDATEAHRLGIFHELVSPDLVWARAHQIAGSCAESAAESLAMTKRMLNETVGDQLSTLLTAGAAVSATARTTEAATEGVAAFLDKRKPNWR